MSKLIISFFLIFVLFNSCQKVPIDYHLVTPNLGARKILVEEFTGANCPNCPKGTDQIKNLAALYCENLIPMSIHAGGFAVKITNSKYDFVVPAGRDLLNLLTPPEGYPTAVIDRKKFPNETGLQLFLPSWAGYIQSESSILPKIQIELTKKYDASTRGGTITAQLTPLEDINFPLKITFAILENKIIDPQKDNRVSGGHVDNYEHNHVLRAILTSSDGDPLGAQFTKDQNLDVTRTFQIPAQDGWWNDENIEIIAFVTAHPLITNTMEVWQVERIKIKD